MYRLTLTQEEALELGVEKYYSGEECPHGHNGYRETNTGACCECRKEALAIVEHGREYYRQQSRKWYRNNTAKHSESVRRWQKKNPDKHYKIVREKNRKWRENNPDKMRQYSAKRRAAKIERTPEWADETKISAIYASTGDKDHVDHIIPLQGEIVSGLHVHNNLQVIPANKNIQKGNRITRHELDTLAREDLKCLKHL